MTDQPIDPKLMRALEAHGRDVGRVIGQVIDARFGQGVVGFCLCFFSFEGAEFTYISNAQREPMIKALEELIQHLRSGEAPTTSEQRN
jgi:hypothetical protein